MHGVGETPEQHLARCPIHDRDQIQEAASIRNERDHLGALDLIGPNDGNALEQVGKDRVRRIQRGRPRPFVDRFEPHHLHQPSNTLPANSYTFPAQMGLDLTAAEERIAGKDPIDRRHHRQRIHIDLDWFLVKGGAAQLQKIALTRDAQDRPTLADHCLLLRSPHRLSP